MTNHESDFDAPRIMLVKEVDGQFDFGLLPEDFRRFDSFHMVCVGIVVRGATGFELLTSHRSMLPANTSASAMRDWQERAIDFVNSQWQKYIQSDFRLPGYPKQGEAFDEMMSHSVRNLGTEVMPEDEIKNLERILHHAFMEMLDCKMGLPMKKGLTGRYAMGGNV